MKRRMIYWAATLGIVGVAMAAWTMTARAGYESAEYEVIESDGNIEIREYPDLMLAATDSKMDSQGRDGSFMRLFRYISGANQDDQKIAMTTPVFMEGEIGKSDVSMGFVMPKEVAAQGVPEPKGEGVEIRKREGGRFAVIRFPGRLDTQLAKQQETKLRKWMEARGLSGAAKAEAAGYDPPFTPAPLRRNEVLIRLTDAENLEAATVRETKTDG
ncbi:SOUL heme-binding protein [Stieleria maiorica]|uniref:SOUL heme-binding protein n=1 Tax=Stieleria maiorica TaxID=2795974 RepID=A0A5B9MJU7_9BACT|nr:heme-binding protein [Stieleria maiorica]QEG00251.1 SOUL heme-binding protein [Stieleria maiorica]